LEELPQPAFLGLLGPAQPWDRKPLDRPRQRIDLLIHHPGQCRRDLRADRQIPAAPVLQREELLDDLLPALELVHAQVLEDRAIVFLKAAAQRSLSPAVDDPVVPGHLRRVKVPGPFDRRYLHVLRLFMFLIVRFSVTLLSNLTLIYSSISRSLVKWSS
jgi:hypothetical protein